ncbi:MAG TPA: tetratricopeptide repeat protein [Anaerolineaceae bacterium]
MNKRRRTSSPFRLLLLVVLVGAALYVNQVVVPATPPLFVPTKTPTRAPESYIVEAESLANQGKLNQAIQAYKAAILASPKNAANYIAIARLQVFTADYDGALENIQNALVLNSNNSTAHAVKGWILGFKDEFLPASASIKTALELDPKNPLAYAYQAEIYARQVDAGKGDLGTTDKAAEASRKAKEYGPNLLESYRARGIVLEMTSNYREAAKEFEAAIKLNENIADLHLALGRNYRVLEQYDKAIEEFNRANALNPMDPMANLYISRTYASVGEFAKAIQYGQQAIKVNPKDPFLYGNLGVLYYRNRAYADAIPPLKLAVRGGLAENNVEVKGLPLDYGRVAEFYTTYALALARTGACGDALQLSQVIQQGVKDDEIAVYNAQEVIRVCQGVASGRTVTPAAPNAARTPTPTARK